MSDDMNEKEGILRMMASGRWAVYRPGRVPVEISRRASQERPFCLIGN
jgi:hypothetical protein